LSDLSDLEKHLTTLTGYAILELSTNRLGEKMSGIREEDMPNCPKCGSDYISIAGSEWIANGDKFQSFVHFICEDCYHHFKLEKFNGSLKEAITEVIFDV
jgi:hypothetical protein